MGSSIRKPSSGEATLSTGIRLHYIEQGRSGGVPVVFLHGYADSWFSFSGVLAAIPAEWHAYALDLRGHGNSEKPDAPCSFDVFSEDVLAFMDVVGAERASVAGHSMGSFIAQRMALTRPDRIERLILLGSAPTSKDNALLAELDATVHKLEDPIDSGFVAEFQSTANPVPAEFMETIISESLKVPARVWKEVLRCLRSEDHSDRLGRISCPTLIGWGDQDAVFTRKDQEDLLRSIPGSILKTYRAGHALHWEKPREIAADLACFLEASS